MADIDTELAALSIDSISHAVDVISPVRSKYLNAVREQSRREDWSETLSIAKQQEINDKCDRAFQLNVVRLWPGGVCTFPLDKLTVAERAGI